MKCNKFAFHILYPVTRTLSSGIILTGALVERDRNINLTKRQTGSILLLIYQLLEKLGGARLKNG